MGNKDISCYSSTVIINHSLAKGIPEKELFKGIEPYKETLKNPLEWTEFSNWNQLALNIQNFFPENPNIIFEFARDITKNQTTFFQLFFLKVASIRLIMSQLPRHIESHINHNLKFTAKIAKSGLCWATVSPKNISQYSKQICDYNMGASIATFELKNYKNVNLIETECAATSKVDSCIYKITWDPEPTILSKIKQFFNFRVRHHKAIIAHMEQNHQKLQEQHKEILALKDFYSHIMRNMTESITWLDKDAVIIFANQGFLKMIGQQDENVVNKKSFSHFMADGQAIKAFSKMLDKCIHDPLKVHQAEFAFKTSTDEICYGETNVIWVPSEHRASGYLITIRDITHTKRIERQLFMAEDRYRALYENSPALIVGVNNTGQFIYANPAMIERSGYTEDELKNMNIAQLLSSDGNLDVSGILDNILNSKTRLQETHFKAKNGEWIAMALNTYQITDSFNRVAGFAAIGVDITETKRLNEQLIQSQRMDLLGQLAQGMAHDIKNIFMSVDGYCQFIEKKSSDEKIIHYARTIAHAGIRASDLMKNLLSFARGQTIEKCDFDVLDIAREINNMMGSIANKDITVKLEIPETPIILYAEPGKVHQIFLNFTMNAREAMGDLAGFITTRVFVAPENAKAVVIEVQDSGPGIPPDVIEKIFDPFFTTKKKSGGTGLGLSVVYGIVKSYKGEISVDSRPGEGATFRVELPIIAKPDNNAAQPQEATAANKIVTVLDSDDLELRYTSDILKSFGYEAMGFASVGPFKDWLSNNPGQAWVVVYNTQMNGMDIRGMIDYCDSVKKGLTCVLLSNCIDAETLALAGKNPLIKRPFTPADLVEALKSIG